MLLLMDPPLKQLLIIYIYFIVYVRFKLRIKFEKRLKRIRLGRKFVWKKEERRKEVHSFNYTFAGLDAIAILIEDNMIPTDIVSFFGSSSSFSPPPPLLLFFFFLFFLSSFLSSYFVDHLLWFFTDPHWKIDRDRYIDKKRERER